MIKLLDLTLVPLLPLAIVKLSMWRLRHPTLQWDQLTNGVIYYLSLYATRNE